MPVVTGELKDIVGQTLASRVGRLKFRLVEPNIVATGSAAGRILPTAEESVTPSSGGSFSVNLADTSTMLADGYYVLSIEWVDSSMPMTDFPDWQIRVGPNGGTLSGLIDTGGGRGGPNLSLVLLGLTQPPNLKRGQLWWKTNPDNPTDSRNTGQIYIGG